MSSRRRDRISTGLATMVRIGFRVLPGQGAQRSTARLDGLPSDELFAMPATRTASVYGESSTAREISVVASVRAGLNHDVHPTPVAAQPRRDTQEPPRHQPVPRAFATARPQLGNNHRP